MNDLIAQGYNVRSETKYFRRPVLSPERETVSLTGTPLQSEWLRMS